MMDLLLRITGLILTFLVVVDILQTTFFLSGTGFISGKISSAMWKFLLKIHKKINSHQFLSYAGSSIILVTFLIWGGLFLTGITLIFLSCDGSVIHAQSKIPADFWEKVYYVGFTVTTLGVGDFIAGSNLWQILTILSSVTGFFLLTLVITYLIPLLSSVKEKRTFASAINNIGSTPKEFLLQLKTIDSFTNLSSLLNTYIPQINSIAQHHLAYPALHYFHSSNMKTAIAPAITILDEALSLIIISNRNNFNKISNLIDPTRNAIENLLVTLQDAYIGSGDGLPKIPDDTIIGQFNPRFVKEDVIQFYDSTSERRKLLMAYVRNDGWEWEEVVN